MSLYHGGYDLLRASACICYEIIYHRGYDLLRASACVCGEITYHKGTICYAHRRVYAVRSHIMGGYDLLRASVYVC